MDDRAALLAAVCDRPDDDTPRLVFADWCDDHGDADYARFVRTQVEHARVPEWDRMWVRAWHRERALVTGRPFWSRYSVPYLATSDAFRRGFPWAVEYPTPALFAEGAAELFTRAPVQSVAVRSEYRNPPPDLNSLVTDPRFARLRRLAFTLARLDANAIRRLADAPYLAGVTELAFEFEGITEHGAIELFRSGLARRVKRLRLHENPLRPISPDDVGGPGELRSLTVSNASIAGHYLTELFAAPLLHALIELDLSGNRLGPDGVAALAASPAAVTLESLTLGRSAPGVPGVRTLAATPALAKLRRLSLRGCDLGPVAVKALAQSPHLRNLTVLDLAGNAIGDKGAFALAESPHLRNLVHLDLTHAEMTDRGAAALLDSPVTANLERLDVSGDLSLETYTRVRERFG